MKKFISLLLALTMLLGLFSGCQKEEEVEEAYTPTGDALLMEGDSVEEYLAEEEEEQVLTLAYNPDRSMNPLIGNSHNNRVLFSLMYQSLFASDSQNNVAPILCSAYQITPDSMIYTFYVDENARFSDGSPVTPEDVLASYQAAQESNYYKGRFTHVTRIEIKDDGGIVFTLGTPYQNFPLLLDIPIVKASEVNADFPLGSGPYIFSDSASGAVLSKSANWWVGQEIAATAQTIHLVEAADDAQIRDEFEFRDVGLVCANPLAGGYADYRCDFERWMIENGVFLYIGCNVTYSDFFQDNPGFARMITHAIDRDYINDMFYRGHGQVATLPASPSSPYYSHSLAENYKYDSLKFIDSLSKVKIPEEDDGKERKLRLLVNTDDSARLRAARHIAEQLTEFGLPCGTLEYSATTNPTYEVVLRAQNYDLYLGQTKLPPTMDLSEFFRPYGNLGWGGLTNFDIYDLNKEALANAGNYYNLHERVAESGYIVPILFGNFAVYATRGLFEGLDPSRDNVFHYTLGKTMKDIQIATEYD